MNFQTLVLRVIVPVCLSVTATSLAFMWSNSASIAACIGFLCALICIEISGVFYR